MELMLKPFTASAATHIFWKPRCATALLNRGFESAVLQRTWVCDTYARELPRNLPRTATKRRELMLVEQVTVLG